MFGRLMRYALDIAIMDTEELKFRIDAFTPETIPMVRLAEYMKEFALLLGNTERVHFSRLESGSTQIISLAEFEAIPKVNQRLIDAVNDEGPEDAIQTVTRLNNMLRDDNAIGTIINKSGAQIIRFPGREIPRPQKIGPFIQQATVDGELISVGGRGATPHAIIQDADGRSWSGEVSRDLARRIAAYLFAGPILRMHGDATWERTESGAWDMKRFRMRDFELVAIETLLESVNRLRNIEGNAWRELDDPIGLIREQRKDNDEIH